MRAFMLLPFLVLAACGNPNARMCAAFDETACRADSRCAAIGGPELEPMAGDKRRCEPGCRAGGLADECQWFTPAATESDPHPTRVCKGPPGQCTVNHTNTGDYCVDLNPPCAGCKEVFKRCQAANPCSGVICP